MLQIPNCKPYSNTMKHVCFFVYIAISTSAQAQHGDSSKFQTSAKATINKVPDSTLIRKPDTIKATWKDSTTLPLELSEQPDSIKIILLKSEEEKENNFYKYWFPLITLFIGAAFTLLSEFVRSWFITRRAGKRWLGQARLYLPIIRNQELLIEEFLQLEDPEKWGIIPLDRASHIEGGQFNAFSEEELLKYLEQHRLIKSDKALNLTSRITGTLGALKLTYTQLDDAYKIYQNSISRFSHEASEILRELGQGLALWTAAIDQRGFVEGEEAPYQNVLQLYQTEIIDKLDQKDRNVFELQEKLFDPMIEPLGAGLAIPEVREILMVLAVAKQTIKKIKAEKVYMRENAENLAKRYKEYREELHQQIEEILHPKRDSSNA